MIRKQPSSLATAKCLPSGLNAKALILELDAFQYATGLVFWFLDWTDFLICSRGMCLRFGVPFA